MLEKLADNMDIGAIVQTVDGYGRFELGKVVERRESSGTYLVKWRGYSLSEASEVEGIWIHPDEPATLVQNKGEYFVFLFGMFCLLLTSAVFEKSP